MFIFIISFNYNYMENNMNKISLSIKTILTVATAMSHRVAISFVLVLLTMTTQADENQLTTQIKTDGLRSLNAALVYNYDYKKLCSEEGECLYCRLITECQAERTWPDKCVTKDIESEFFILATGGCNTRIELDCYQCDCSDEPPFNCSSIKDIFSYNKP